MRLGKPAKVLIALATIWPLVYVFLFIGFCFFSVLTGFGRTKPPGEAPPYFFVVLIVLHLFTMFWLLALAIFYIVYLYKTDRVAQDKKALWAVVLLLGNFFAMPVFWYLYIWHEPTGAEKAKAT